MRTTKPKGNAGSAKTKRILIVDDDPQVLEIFSALLHEVGYEVESAENALAAMASVVNRAPDLILADLRMPIFGGLDLTRELKSHEDSRRIPVVAFTGYDSPELREAALKAGFDDYLPKPLDPGPFLDRIEELIRRFAAKGTRARPGGKAAAQKPKASRTSKRIGKG